MRAGGVAVLNAHDPNLVGLAATLACDVTFFADLDGPAGPALDAARTVIDAAAAKGQGAVVAEQGMISVRGEGGYLLRVDEIPITFGDAN